MNAKQSADARALRLTTRLSLLGFTATPAELEVAPRPRWKRIGIALLVFAAGVATVPVATLLPPHVEWGVLTLLWSVYWARRHLLAEYTVRSMSGVCPRCGGTVTVRRGALLHMPQGVVCFRCRQAPRLEEGAAPPLEGRDFAAAVPEEAAPAPKVVGALSRADAERFWRYMRASRTSGWNPSSGEWSSRGE